MGTPLGRGFHKDSGPMTPERKGDMKKTLKLSAVLGAIALIATTLTTTSATAATAYCDDFKQFGKFNNVTVKVFAGIRDPEASVMTKVFAHFTACTGIKIAYEGTDQFETLLPVRVKGGNAPDIAIIPQPGLVTTMVNTGKAVPVTGQTLANINRYYNPAWKTFTTVRAKFMVHHSVLHLSHLYGTHQHSSQKLVQRFQQHGQRWMLLEQSSRVQE